MNSIVLGDELVADHIYFTFFDDSFQKVSDDKKELYEKEIADVLGIDYDELCDGKGEGDDPYPVDKRNLRDAMKNLGDKYNLNVIALRYIIGDGKDSNDWDTDAHDWSAFLYFKKKSSMGQVYDVANYKSSHSIGWAEVVLDNYSAEEIIEMLIEKLLKNTKNFTEEERDQMSNFAREFLNSHIAGYINEEMFLEEYGDEISDDEE